MASRPARVITRLMPRPSRSSHQTGMPGLARVSRMNLRVMRLSAAFAGGGLRIVAGAITAPSSRAATFESSINCVPVSFANFSSFACDSVRCHQHDPALAARPAGLGEVGANCAGNAPRQAMLCAGKKSSRLWPRRHAKPTKNAALVTTVTELRLADGVTLFTKFDGEFASRRRPCFFHPHPSAAAAGDVILSDFGLLIGPGLKPLKARSISSSRVGFAGLFPCSAGRPFPRPRPRATPDFSAAGTTKLPRGVVIGQAMRVEEDGAGAGRSRRNSVAGEAAATERRAGQGIKYVCTLQRKSVPT